MRKIAREYDNFIDNILIDICEVLSPIAYFLGLTPNILTTISVIFTGISTYYLYNYNYNIASLMYMIAYYFDCMDGYYARRYKMYSKFGDYYDHFADIFKFSSISFVLYKNNHDKFIMYIPFIFILAILFNIHIGYQELYYDKPESDILGLLTKICPIKDKNDKNELSNILQYTKWFGCGTFNLIFAIIIYLY